MKKLEQSALLAAHENHTHERREPAYWRIAIRSHIGQDPVELSAETKMVNGIYENNWLKLNDLNEAKNLASDAKRKLDQYLRSHHIEDIEPGRTMNIQTEIFLKLGYVFSTSRKIYEKKEAEALMKEWQERGLQCFMMAELPKDSDLYASEALLFTKYADLVKKTDHLVVKGHQGRVPGTVELCFMDEDEDIIHQVKKTVDAAFQGLEKEGFAVRIRGFNLCFTWSGITLTRAGVAMAETIKEEAYQDFLTAQAAKAESQCKIKCLSCGEILLQTTSLFRSDKAVVGNMVELLSNLSQAGWAVDFGSSDTMEALVCPNCGTGLIDYDSGRFQKGVLISMESEGSEGEEAGVDVLDNFISERCVTGPDKESTAGDLYTTYESWVRDMGEEPVSKKAFGLTLAERGFSASRASGGVRIWTGIGLRRDVL